MLKNPQPFMTAPTHWISAHGLAAADALQRFYLPAVTDAIISCLLAFTKLDGLVTLSNRVALMYRIFPPRVRAAGYDATSAFAAARAGWPMRGRMAGICAARADRDLGLFNAACGPWVWVGLCSPAIALRIFYGHQTMERALASWLTPAGREPFWTSRALWVLLLVVAGVKGGGAGGALDVVFCGAAAPEPLLRGFEPRLGSVSFPAEEKILPGRSRGRFHQRGMGTKSSKADRGAFRASSRPPHVVERVFTSAAPSGAMGAGASTSRGPVFGGTSTSCASGSALIALRQVSQVFRP